MLGPEVHPARSPLPGEPEVVLRQAGGLLPEPDVFQGAAEADLSCLAVRNALDRLSTVLARAATAFVRLRAWTVFGFARLEDHVRERYGRSGRWLRDLATLGDGLAASPELAAALSGRDGGPPVGRVAATMLARALRLGPSASDWIAAARRLSVRELRDAIRAARDEAADRPPGAGAEPRSTRPDDADVDPDADRSLLRLPVPEPLLTAFDEALDLHRAVQGRGASVTEFIEALVGEAQAGGLDIGDGLVAPLRRGLPEAQLEAALRRATDAWSALPQPGAAPAVGSSGSAAPLPGPDADAADALARFAALEARAGEGDASELDAQIRALVLLENQLEATLGLLLTGMTERREWTRLQFAGVGHYAEERLGMSRSRAVERTRLARALRALPAVAAACAEGRIPMESAALIHRILDSSAAEPGEAAEAADLEMAWVAHASTTTIKRMRDEARVLGRYRSKARSRLGRDPLDGPPAVPPLSDQEWCSSLRREVGTAIHRIQEFGFLAAGIIRPTDGPEPDVFHRMLREPDAFLRLRLPAQVAGAFLGAVEAARSAIEERVAAIPWDEPWPASPLTGAFPIEPASAWAARIAFVRGRRVPMWVGLLALIEDFAVTWDTDGAAPERRDDTTFVRDGWRCAAPGCSSRRNLEDHHIVYRSRGGPDDGWNRITLCRFHHQCGEHGGLMQVRGRAPLDLTWRLGRDDVRVAYRADVRVGAGAGA